MFGKNKILKAEIHQGLNLDIQEIFATLQGEGPYVGHPSVFIRLGGCNLACEFCDTEFDSYKNFSVQEILDEVQKLAKNSVGKIVRKLVVITGGEPLRQPIERLCEELIKLNFLVQIETNGTLFRQLPKEVKIICSPKISNGKYHKIRPDLLERINAFKFIVRDFSNNHSDLDFCHPERSEGSQTNKLPNQTPEILRHAQDDIMRCKDDSDSYANIAEVGQSQFNIPVYVQPMDEYNEVKNKANVEYAKKLCEENYYFLSLQTHKILGIR